MTSRNPVFTQSAFASNYEFAEVMTVQGTIYKTCLLLAGVIFAAWYPWNLFIRSGSFKVLEPLLTIGIIGGFIVALLTIWKKSWSPVTAPIYAILEGLSLGSISVLLEREFSGIALTSLSLTFATLFCFLVVYRLGYIAVTHKFKSVITAVTAGIALLYFVMLVLELFNITIPALYGAGIVSIVFSVFVVGVAAFNLILDFDMIENGARDGAPKYMEWYAAFGLMVTLVWLYLEIMQLLSKLRKRR